MSRVWKKAIPIGTPAEAERKYAKATSEVKELLKRGKISRSNFFLKELRIAANVDGDVLDWLKLRGIEPDNEANTTL